MVLIVETLKIYWSQNIFELTENNYRTWCSRHMSMTRGGSNHVDISTYILSISICVHLETLEIYFSFNSYLNRYLKPEKRRYKRFECGRVKTIIFCVQFWHVVLTHNYSCLGPSREIAKYTANSYLSLHTVMNLGSIRKSVGMGAGYREFSYDNKRVSWARWTWDTSLDRNHI